MKKRVKHIFILSMLASVLLYSCSSKEKEVPLDSEELLSFDVSTLDDREYDVNLSELMESVEIIQLDNSTEEAFGRIVDVAISKNYIATINVGNCVKLYKRKNGRFLGNIGNRGQGPGEYLSVSEIKIDEDENRIYIWAGMRDHIYSYDLNGTFIPKETIYLPKGCTTRGIIFPNRKKNEVIVFGTPYSHYQRENTLYENEKNVCWIQDFKGNIRDSIPASNFIIQRSSSFCWASHIDPNTPIYSYALRTIRSEMRRDTIYHYNSMTNQLYPVYTNNYPHESNNVITSLESVSHYYTIYATYRKGRITNPENLLEYKILQVDKKTHNGKYIRMMNDYLCGIEVVLYDFLISTKNNYSFIDYHPLDLKDQLEEALETNKDMSDEVRKRITRMKNRLNENDNDILVICKFKKEI